MTHRILVSSNTQVIYTLKYDPSVPSLELEHESHVGYHPSWITSYPGNKSLIFTGLEHKEGQVVAVTFDDSGKGTVAKQITSGGSEPCSLVATKDELYVANYSGGGIALVPIFHTPPYLLAPSPSYMLEVSGSGPNKDRQQTSHPHQVVLIGEYGELLVPDLGADKVWRFKKNQQTGGEQEEWRWSLEGHVTYEPGCGPRHIAFYEGFLYTLCELTNILVKHRLPPLPAEPEYIAQSPTMATKPPPGIMFAAEILISSPNSTFSVPYLYVSNRNDPSPEGDSISIFAVDETRTLRCVNEVRTGLKHLRGMEFGGEDDKWLIAGGLLEGGVKVFQRVADGTELKVVAEYKDVEAPAGFLWL